MGQTVFDLSHVTDRNSFRDRNDQRNLRIDCLKNGIRGKWGRNIDCGDAGSFLLHGFTNGIKHWHGVLKSLPALARCDTSHYVGPILDALRRV